MKAKDFGISISDLNDLIDEWIFSERDRAIAKRRFLDGIRIEALAEEMKLSPRQTRTIIHDSANQLKQHITQ